MTEKIKVPTFDNMATFVDQIDEKYASKEQVTAEINTKLSSTYRAGGSAAFEDLPELSAANLGLVVNVTGSFTTTNSFVEGAGQEHPAGTNVVVVQSSEDYKYDVLAGFVDLSGYAEADQVAEDIDSAKTAAVAQADANTDKKLAGYLKPEDIEPITEEEIIALFQK